MQRSQLQKNKQLLHLFMTYQLNPKGKDTT